MCDPYSEFYTTSAASGIKNGARESYQLHQSGLHLGESFPQMFLCETDTSYFYYDGDQANVDHLLQELILFPLP